MLSYSILDTKACERNISWGTKFEGNVVAFSTFTQRGKPVFLSVSCPANNHKVHGRTGGLRIQKIQLKNCKNCGLPSSSISRASKTSESPVFFDSSKINGPGGRTWTHRFAKASPTRKCASTLHWQTSLGLAFHKSNKKPPRRTCTMSFQAYPRFHLSCLIERRRAPNTHVTRGMPTPLHDANFCAQNSILCVCYQNSACLMFSGARHGEKRLKYDDTLHLRSYNGTSKVSQWEVYESCFSKRPSWWNWDPEKIVLPLANWKTKYFSVVVLM